MTDESSDAAGGEGASILEMAADDDVAGLRRALSDDPTAADRPALWYCRMNRRSSPLLRTPLMVAATYGSVLAIEFLLSLPAVEAARRAPSADGSSALHCAASGGSPSAAAVVRLLLAAGADPLAADSDGRLPRDVIAVTPRSPDLKSALYNLLGGANSPTPPTRRHQLSQPPLLPEKKEYPADPLLPDIKNGFYASDEFRMYSFKVRPCSRTYSHDWTECPFLHPGENARRRDPRKYHYSCVPCPDFRKGACRRGDLCEYAHGVFESWLHPAQYRTRLCKDGDACARRVCFFAHNDDELRPLYPATGSAAEGLITPPLSPLGGGIAGWPLSPFNVLPALHLAGSNNLQLSRLRVSLSARELPLDEFPGLRSPHSKTVVPTNLEDLYLAAEIGGGSLSPRYAEQVGKMFSPTHRTAILNQLQQQQSLLSPINTSGFAVSPGRMSPLSTPTESLSPLCSQMLAAMALQERAQQESMLLNMSTHDAATSAGLPVGSARGAAPSMMPVWEVNGEDDIGLLEYLSPFELSHQVSGGHGEPDVSWVNSLVKEVVPEKPVAAVGMATTLCSNGRAVATPASSNSEDGDDSTVLCAWIDQLVV